MATYNVTPKSTGRNDWKVEKNSRTFSEHQTQQNAINRARRDGSAGDTMIVHRPDGTIRDRKTLR